MNTLGPLILLCITFAFLLGVRVVILLVLRSGEMTKRPRIAAGSPPTIIRDSLFLEHPDA